jgi:hypothetical protein
LPGPEPVPQFGMRTDEPIGSCGHARATWTDDLQTSANANRGRPQLDRPNGFSDPSSRRRRRTSERKPSRTERFFSVGNATGSLATGGGSSGSLDGAPSCSIRSYASTLARASSSSLKPSSTAWGDLRHQIETAPRSARKRPVNDMYKLAGWPEAIPRGRPWGSVSRLYGRHPPRRLLRTARRRPRWLIIDVAARAPRSARPGLQLLLGGWVRCHLTQARSGRSWPNRWRRSNSASAMTARSEMSADPSARLESASHERIRTRSLTRTPTTGRIERGWQIPTA